MSVLESISKTKTNLEKSEKQSNFITEENTDQEFCEFFSSSKNFYPITFIIHLLSILLKLLTGLYGYSGIKIEYYFLL